MDKFRAAILLSILFCQALRADELPDAEFLEWLGQITEVEELGVDTNKLIEQHELDVQSEENEEEYND